MVKGHNVNKAPGYGEISTAMLKLLESVLVRDYHQVLLL